MILMLFLILIVIVLGYLIGSIPFGYLIGKIKGIDIREHGSGNIGTTNVWRTLGAGYGLAAFACDFGKGVLAFYLGAWVGANFTDYWIGLEYLGLITGAAALVGHSWSIFLHFSGGKIVATGAGVVLAISPLTLLTVLAIWGLVLLLSRYVSLSSIAAALALPAAIYIWEKDWVLFIFAILTALTLLFKHWPNIKRLAAGQEFKLGSSKKSK